LQCSVCSVRFAVFGLQCSVCSVRFAVFGLQCSVCSVRFAVFGGRAGENSFAANEFIICCILRYSACLVQYLLFSMPIANRRSNHYTSAMRIARHAALLLALVCALLPLPCQAWFPVGKMRRVRCSKNCKNLNLALSIAQQCGMTNITSLDALMPAIIKVMPVCPAGGTYVLGTNGTPKCTLPWDQHRFRPFKGAVVAVHCITGLALAIPLLLLWRGCNERLAATACSSVALASVCLAVMPWLILALMLIAPWHRLLNVLPGTPVLLVRLSDSVWCWLLGLICLSGVFSVIYGNVAHNRLRQTASSTWSGVAVLGEVLGFVSLAAFMWQLFVIATEITFINVL